MSQYFHAGISVMEEIRRITADGLDISYMLIRKKIKNMYLRVRDGIIIVTANERIPKKTVDQFVRSNAAYIRKHLKPEKTESEQMQYADGMKALILGKERTVRFIQGKTFAYDFSADPVTITVKDPVDLKINENVYKKALRLYTEALLLNICRQYYPYFEPYGIAFPKISFRHMTSRWGSCRPRNQAVTLNTALIKAPKEAAEYIVVHEFTHFLHPDHSRSFYEAVARVMPDWKERRQLLRHVAP